jgi:hypothetical protein
MKPQSTRPLPVLTYNETVQKAYLHILKEAKALLAAIAEEPLRFTLIREEKKPVTTGVIVHELVNPLIYLRLECYAENKLGIHYGWELSPTFGPYYHITSSFIRLLYKATMADATPINIEDCIRTDYVLNETSALYEYIEERGCKHHRFELVKHKAKQAKRKLRKVA